MPALLSPNSRLVFRGKVVDVWAWEQKLFDGTSEIFECVTRPDTVTVIPFLDADTVLLTRQTQPHKQEPFMDFPGGRVDAGETMEAASQRELREETGYHAEHIREWHRHAHSGLNRFEECLFIATDLQDGYDPRYDPGEHIETFPIPWGEVVDLCLTRRLRQPNVMLAVLMMTFHTETRKKLQAWLTKG